MIIKISKRFGLCFALAAGIFSATQLQAQEWQNEIASDSNFFEIRKAFDQEFVAPEEEEDGDNEQFNRWAHIIGPRVADNNGKPFPPDIIYTEWKKFMSKPMPSVRGKNGSWSYAGPKTTPTRGGGNGRINCFEFDPTNTDIMWAGTPAGGLWKSMNGGKTWETNTDNLPNLGVTDILINPRNTDTMYIATGDGFGYSIGNGNFWGGTYSMGVLRSTDGGKTWAETGLNWKRNETRQIYKMVLQPNDPNTIYATTNTGIWKSVNAGKDWIMLIGGSGYKDLLFHPTKTGLLLATSSNSIIISTNFGETWKSSQILPQLPSMRGIVLAVAPGADSVMYALCCSSTNNGSVYKSEDYGFTWNQTPGFISTTFQGWYDLALGVSPKDPNQVIIGGLDIMKTYDGGQSWTTITDWYNWQFSNYVHADQRAVIYYPGSNDSFIVINDGGIFRTTTSGTTWSNIASNISVLQFYKIGSMPSNDGIIFGGAQDNGINRGKAGVWSQVMGADGMEVVASHQNPNVVYAASQNGNLQKSTNGGTNFFQYVAPTSGSWLTPVEMDMSDADMLYFGSKHLYRTLDGGKQWTDLTPTLNVGGDITSVELTSSPDIVYIAHTTASSASSIRLRKTVDNGKTWTLIKGLPTIPLFLSDIGADPKDPGHLFITISGYSEKYKVYESKDTGATWKNVTENLPNVPINCVQIEGSMEEGVYIGTDLGVFYRNSESAEWKFFNDDLPLVMVNELEILPQFNKVRAATYGRGAWEAPLSGTLTSINRMKHIAKDIMLYPNPSATYTTLKLPETGVALNEIRIYDMSGKCLQTIKSNPLETQITLDIKHFSPGIYMVNLLMAEGTVTKKLNVVR